MGVTPPLDVPFEATRAPAGSSCLYEGGTSHCRLVPFRHAFRYRFFSLYLDLDALPRCRLLSYNRFNLFSYHDRDHGARDGTPAADWARAACRRHLGFEVGPVHLLCFPRVLGYVFNPLSLYFCYDNSGRPQAVLYEVRNAYKHLHGYLHRLSPFETVHCHESDKAFYVSPFLPLAARYRFRLTVPGEQFSLLIRTEADGKTLHYATQTGVRRPLTDGMLLRLFFRYFLMSWRVTGRIWHQAFRLWRQGLIFKKAPPPPQNEISS